MLAFIATALALGVADVPNPMAGGSAVADVADVLPPDAEARLDAKIAALRGETGAQIAVVTLAETDTTPKAFATALFQR